MSDRGFARGEFLVDAEWLRAHLHDADLRVVEVDVNGAAYTDGHIEGAVLWNIYSDLRDADYQLVGTSAIQELFERSGIQPSTTVVFYGYAPTLGFWLMTLFGHTAARVLDCSRSFWKESGLPWTSAVPEIAPTVYPLPTENKAVRATASEVERAIENPATTILDVRTDNEFRGERFWPSGGSQPGGQAGHVPSALHLVIDGLRDETGAFKNADEVRSVFAAVEPADPADPAASGELITYCTVGVRASVAWFALSYLLGRDTVRVYDGSWAEWGLLPGAAVAR